MLGRLIFHQSSVMVVFMVSLDARNTREVLVSSNLMILTGVFIMHLGVESVAGYIVCIYRMRSVFSKQESLFFVVNVWSVKVSEMSNKSASDEHDAMHRTERSSAMNGSLIKCFIKCEIFVG